MKRLYISVGIAALWTTTALAEVPQVVTDIPAVHSLVAQVMGDLGAPVVLVSGSADAHSYQLRPSQARALANADLVFWIGPEMTPWLERALAADTSAKIVGLLAAEGTLTRQYSHDHADASVEDTDDLPVAALQLERPAALDRVARILPRTDGAPVRDLSADDHRSASADDEIHVGDTFVLFRVARLCGLPAPVNYRE